MKLAQRNLREITEAPEHLQRTLQTLDKRLADLSYEEYKSFIAIDRLAHEILASMTGKLLPTTKSLQSLQSLRTAFESGTESLLGNKQRSMVSLDTHHQSTGRTQNSAGSVGLVQEKAECQLLIKTYPKLAGILDIPRVMESLISGCFYEEAMDLQQYVGRLQMRFPRVELFRQVFAKVQTQSRIMRKKLIDELQASNALHNSIRIIGYLKRMQVFSEIELRMIFLIGRYKYYRNVLLANTNILDSVQQQLSEKQKTESDAMTYAKALLDNSRSLFVDIFTQYHAIFMEFGSDSGVLLENGELFNDLPTSASILYSFMNHLIEELLGELTQTIDSIFDFGSLSNLLTQSMHFGVALARKGMDIRHRLGAIFRKRLDSIFRQHLDRATNDFIREIELNGMQNMVSRTQTQSQQHQNAARQMLLGSNEHSTQKSLSPPQMLLEFPPLAGLLNSYLQAFNMFRATPIIALTSNLMEIFIGNSEKISKVLTEYHQSKLSQISIAADQTNSKKEKIFVEFCKVFADVFLPFITRCIVDGLNGGVIPVLPRKNQYPSIEQLSKQLRQIE